MKTRNNLTYIFTIFCVLLPWVLSQISILPPYQNLAKNAHITASSTCGDKGAEKFCKVRVNNDRWSVVARVATCIHCFQDHYPAEMVVDDSPSSYWQSPPLSRGPQYHRGDLTLDLGQESSVSWIRIKMGDSPRPKVWALERSMDNGTTWMTWQYFADNVTDCQRYFGTTLQEITEDTSVICDTRYSSKEPQEGGEILVSLLEGHPSANNFFSSPNLQEWTYATHIRFAFMRLHTIMFDDEREQVLELNTRDIAARSFYSVKDISVRGTKRQTCNC